MNLSHFHSQMPDLFPKNFDVIHTTRIVHLDSVSVGECVTASTVWTSSNRLVSSTKIPQFKM